MARFDPEITPQIKVLQADEQPEQSEQPEHAEESVELEQSVQPEQSEQSGQPEQPSLFLRIKLLFLARQKTMLAFCGALSLFFPA